MSHLLVTYQKIANILSFEYPNCHLKGELNTPDYNWDAIVTEGSKQLMLPAIFCRLKTKQLCSHLPEELYIYLEELTNINRNRNHSILEQIHEISALLTKHNINHVFLKGAALLAMDVYTDIAERMVGDIDILVAPDQIKLAFQLIKASGYSKTKGFNYETIGFRHLDRLINSNKLAAIELHDNLFNANKRYLISTEDVLTSKSTPKTVSLPSPTHMIEHIVLASQVNDHQFFHKSISFKTIYDYLLIFNSINEQNHTPLATTKYSQAFYAISSLYFNDINPGTGKVMVEYYRFLHKLSFNTYGLGTLIRLIKALTKALTDRMRLLLTNPFYRKYVVKKIFTLKLA